MTTEDIIVEDLILQSKPIQENKFNSLKEAKNQFEVNYISNLLLLTRGNVSKAAKLAGKYRADFYGLLKKHDLNPSDSKRTKQGV